MKIRWVIMGLILVVFISGCEQLFDKGVIEKESEPVCGDGKLDSGETSENCCVDAGCPMGQTCKDNRCIQLRPEITTSFTQQNKESVTILKSKNNQINIGNLVLSNIGNDLAKDIKVTLSSGDNYFDSKTLTYNQINVENSESKETSLNFKDSILEIAEPRTINIDIIVDFSSSANQKFTSTSSHSFEVYGRNSISSGWPSSYSAWVTPHQNVVREFGAKSTSGLAAGCQNCGSQVEQDLAARWLFESMKSYGIDYVNDVPTVGDYVQLPYETLKRRNGDCEDLAVLYASLLESVGIESIIIRIPGHVFAGYINKEGVLIPVETTADNFDTALSTGYYEYQNNQDKKMIKPRTGWTSYPEVVNTNEPTIPLPDITKQIGDCSISWNWQDFFVASVDIELYNSGDSPGAGCVAVATYQSGQLKDSIFNCWTLNPGETKEVNLQPDVSIFEGYTCVAY